MPSIRKRETTEWVKAVAQTYGKKVGEIAYIFCSDEKILEVNRQETASRATSSSASTRCAPMPNSSEPRMTPSCTGSSSTASCTCAASTTRVRASAKSWSKPRTRHSPCWRRWKDETHHNIVEQNWFAKNRMEHRDTKAQSSIFLRGQSSRRKDLVRRSLSFLYLFLRGSVPLCSSFNHTPLLMERRDAKAQRVVFIQTHRAMSTYAINQLSSPMQSGPQS